MSPKGAPGSSRTSGAVLGAAVLTGLLLAAVAACGGSPGAGDDESRELLVSAAASLTDAFTEMEHRFEAANQGVDVVLNLGGSSALREQILGGAPVDVFAAADPSIVGRVVESGHVTEEPRIFALNELRIAVPTGNPSEVAGLADFDRPDLLLGLCDSGVPCGSLADEVLESAGVVPSADTREPNVRALLTKIEAGELDAGIVYATDVAAAGGRVSGIDIPAEHNAVAQYPIAVLANSRNAEDAEAFVAFVLSDDGQAILARHGFSPP